MLFAGKTRSGNHLVPKWFAKIFGGTYCSCKHSGYSWRPPCWRLAIRYFKEGWTGGFIEFVFRDYIICLICRGEKLCRK